MILSWQAHPDEIQLLVVVVNYKTKLVKPRRGLCSTWLASLDPFEQRLSCTCWVKKGTISFPKALDSPIVMLGPGNLNGGTIFFSSSYLYFYMISQSPFEHYWIFYRQAEAFKRQHVAIRMHLALQSWRLFSEKYTPHNLCLPHKCAYGWSFFFEKTARAS